MLPQNPIRLSELTGRIRDTLREAFADRRYWVFADITGYNFKADRNHHYFDLVEKGERDMITRISAAAWAEGHQRIRLFEEATGQHFQNGINVLVQVSVEYHLVYGLKLTLHDIDTSFTLGELEKQKQDTLRRLLAECADFIRLEQGRIVTRNMGHPLRPVIQRIAVVSSRQSAGYEDFIHTLNTNAFGYRFDIDPFFTTVQGQANANEFFNRLLDVFNAGKPYDAVVIIRGGGAETDFLIFNQFILGKIVAKFPIPVITGIGHQRNETIVDLMAHTATKTPTKSAEFIIAHNRRFEESILALQKSLLLQARQTLSDQFQSLARLHGTVVNRSRDGLDHHRLSLATLHRITTQNSARLLHDRRNELVSLSSRVIAQPRISIGNRKHELVSLLANIKTFQAQFVKNQRGYLGHLDALVRVASPSNILARGFALVRKKGNIITDPSLIDTADEITVELARTEISAKVSGKKEME